MKYAGPDNLPGSTHAGSRCCASMCITRKEGARTGNLKAQDRQGLHYAYCEYSYVAVVGLVRALCRCGCEANHRRNSATSAGSPVFVKSPSSASSRQPLRLLKVASCTLLSCPRRGADRHSYVLVCARGGAALNVNVVFDAVLARLCARAHRRQAALACVKWRRH